MIDAATPLIDVRHLSVHYRTHAKLFSRAPAPVVKAVSDISFSIAPGETLGLVGESGCGKSTTGRAITLLDRPTAGEISFNGQSLMDMTLDGLRHTRRAMQMIFQDPYSSLTPHFTAGELIAEPIRVHKVRSSQKEVADRVNELLETVGLNPDAARRYPHEFSGGQRQRIGIARALAVEPKFIVCDEAVSALDVSVQAQVINLLQDLQKKLGLTYLFISHALGVVHHISDRIAVMYLGKIVEVADADELIDTTLHPYSQALLSAVPVPDPVTERKRSRIILEGDLPSPLNPPSGCRFHTRCRFADQLCREDEPHLRNVGAKTGSSHLVACHRVQNL